MNKEAWDQQGDGDCYRLAVEVAHKLELEGKYPSVVHGLVTGTGGEAKDIRYGHAWVECGGRVYDASHPHHGLICIPREVYYLLGSIDPDECFFYPVAEAREAMLEKETYGPWHDCN